MSVLRCRGGLAPSSSPRRRCRVEAKIREIFMPALNSTMTEGKIISWNAAKGDPVVIVESDKADMDFKMLHDSFLTAVVPVLHGSESRPRPNLMVCAQAKVKLESATDTVTTSRGTPSPCRSAARARRPCRPLSGSAPMPSSSPSPRCLSCSRHHPRRTWSRHRHRLVSKQQSRGGAATRLCFRQRWGTTSSSSSFFPFSLLLVFLLPLLSPAHLPSSPSLSDELPW